MPEPSTARHRQHAGQAPAARPRQARSSRSQSPTDRSRSTRAKSSKTPAEKNQPPPARRSPSQEAPPQRNSLANQAPIPGTQAYDDLVEDALECNSDDDELDKLVKLNAARAREAGNSEEGKQEAEPSTRGLTSQPTAEAGHSSESQPQQPPDPATTASSARVGKKTAAMQRRAGGAEHAEWRRKAFEEGTEKRALEAERSAAATEKAAETDRKAAYDKEMKRLFAELRAKRTAEAAEAAQAEDAKKAAAAKEKSARDQAIKTKTAAARMQADGEASQGNKAYLAAEEEKQRRARDEAEKKSREPTETEKQRQADSRKARTAEPPGRNETTSGSTKRKRGRSPDQQLNRNIRALQPSSGKTQLERHAGASQAAEENRREWAERMWKDVLGDQSEQSTVGNEQRAPAQSRQAKEPFHNLPQSNPQHAERRPQPPPAQTRATREKVSEHEAETWAAELSSQTTQPDSRPSHSREPPHRAQPPQNTATADRTDTRRRLLEPPSRQQQQRRDEPSKPKSAAGRHTQEQARGSDGRRDWKNERAGTAGLSSSREPQGRRPAADITPKQAARTQVATRASAEEGGPQGSATPNKDGGVPVNKETWDRRIAQARMVAESAAKQFIEIAAQLPKELFSGPSPAAMNEIIETAFDRGSLKWHEDQTTSRVSNSLATILSEKRGLLHGALQLKYLNKIALPRKVGSRHLVVSRNEPLTNESIAGLTSEIGTLSLSFYLPRGDGETGALKWNHTAGKYEHCSAPQCTWFLRGKDPPITATVT